MIYVVGVGSHELGCGGHIGLDHTSSHHQRVIALFFSSASDTGASLLTHVPPTRGSRRPEPGPSCFNRASASASSSLRCSASSRRASSWHSPIILITSSSMTRAVSSLKGFSPPYPPDPPR